jgi:AcrR family transcriptional regulator
MTQHRASKQDQLLEAATQLFREKGYHHTSMQDLADALGMQKGSLYYYIDGKQDLLRKLLERATSLLAAGIDDIYTSDLPPTEKLRWALEQHALAIMENLDLVSVYLHEYRSLPPAQVDKALAVRKRYERVLMQIVEDGMAAGDFRPVDAKVAVFGLLGMLNWTQEWFSPEGTFTAPEVAGMLVSLAVEGLVGHKK